MTRKPRSRTGRGLSTALSGEIVVVVVCFAYLLTDSVRLLVLGLLVAGLVGFASVVSLWRGQDEFGPEQRRHARRGTYTYLLASLLFVLSFLSFQTFPSATTGIDLTGDNETTSPTTPHRFRDLIPPTVLLAGALVSETISGAYFLWGLVGHDWRRWVAFYGASGLAAAIPVLTIGIAAIQEFRAENGEGVQSQAGADYYFDLFLARVLFVFAITFAATRVAAVLLVRRAKAKVAEAEAETPPMEATGA